MLNPTLNRKTEKNFEITENAKKLFQVIYNEQNKNEDDENEPKLKVSVLISKMAFYYEKIRNSVDYKEEYLLRKNAILRILRRQIVLEGMVKETSSNEISKNLLVELIRAGYLKNNNVPEYKIDEIGKIVNKYIKLRNYSLVAFQKTENFKTKRELVNWILFIAASEIEEKLGRNKITQVEINEIYEILSSAIKLPEDSPFEADREIQIFVSIHRNLLKFDSDMIGFILFKYYNADWTDPSDEKIKKIGENIEILRQAINRQLAHPLAGQLNKIVNRYTVYFSILSEVIEENPVLVYNSFKDDPKAFPRNIKKICNRRYGQAKSKLWRAAVRSIIYIFLTKSIFAIAIEIPATKFFGDALNMTALAINVSFPALLLFLIVLFTKLPSEKNTEDIIAGINNIAFEGHKNEEIRLRQAAKRNKFLNSVFGSLYSVTFLFSVGFIIWALDKIGFNFVSITIFLFFLAFVSFFAIRIRKNAHELIIVESRENIFTFLTDFFYIPIVAFGKWLSEKFSRINLFVFILDFIIESPFKIFVDIAEEWTKYIRERKEDIV